MTKAERAELESLKSLLAAAEAQTAVARALGWSGHVDAEKLPLPDFGKYVNGWACRAYGQGDVFPAWSECTAHHTGAHRVKGEARATATQNGRRLYATRLDALIRLRLEKETDYATNLARIDALIAAERAAPTETPQ